MADPVMGRCGIDCEKCQYREPRNCPGCHATDGTLYWGECDVAKCCIGRDLEHCGQCQEFPCKTLNDYACDPTHGDQGRRIANLREWNEKGYEAWRNVHS